MTAKGISAGVWIFGSCSDRYVAKGYKPYIDFYERINRISEIKGIKAVEITFPGDLNKSNIDEVKTFLKEKNLEISCIGVELVCDAEWESGSFSSWDPDRREKSKRLTKEAMNIAKELGVSVVNLWLGQDGFDYVFQSNYSDSWHHMVEGIRECADHCPEVKLGIEYKNSEPRMNCIINSGGKALALAQATGRANVGITLDIGHAFNAGENPAEIASVLLAENRLFHLHLNDNYRISDDDMPVGSVHLLHYLELFYWLDKLGYDGWYSLDLYPYRDDPSSACRASITFIERAIEFVREKIIKDDFTQDRSLPPGETLNELYLRLLGREVVKG